ncbi:MAG: hypothetical protein ACLQIB_04540, partial [Isosphaeraceae bacterium]
QEAGITEFKRVDGMPLNSYLVNKTAQLISKSSKHKKPLQFHTGLGDNDITLTRSSPAHLQVAADVQSPGTTNPQIPTELQTICVKALESDPAARCASWAQLIADLRRFLGIKRPGWLKRRGEESAPPPSP